MKLSLGEMLEATLGTARDAREGAPMRIVTDTRGIEPGDAFLALRGDNYDGHDFVGDAFEKGAVTAVVADAGALPAGRAGLIVADTLRAYLALARAARARFSGKVLAITGSSGKTTTKALLAQLLGHAGVVAAATPQNENNEIGVSKLLLSLAGNEAAVVVEMGSRHPGDIAILAEAARPDFGVLTNIGEAHLEIMGSREAIAATKWGLFSTGAAAILNVHDVASLERASALPEAPRWFAFGDGSNEVPAGADVLLIPERGRVIFKSAKATLGYAVRMALPGDHNLANLAAALAGAHALGAAPDALAAAVAGLVLPPGRYERVSIAGGVTAVYDAYNASQSGTLAALHAFASEAGTRRIAVLGGMAELGPESPQMHARVGTAAAEAVDVVLAGGTYGEDVARGARDGGMPSERVVVYGDNAGALAWLRANLRAGDAVLLKGSRMYHLEQILDELRERGVSG